MYCSSPLLMIPNTGGFGLGVEIYVLSPFLYQKPSYDVMAMGHTKVSLMQVRFTGMQMHHCE